MCCNYNERAEEKLEIKPLRFYKGIKLVLTMLTPGQWSALTIGGGLLAVCYQWGILSTIFYITIHLLVVGAGIFMGVSWSIARGSRYKPTPKPKEALVAGALLQKLMVTSYNIHFFFNSFVAETNPDIYKSVLKIAQSYIIPYFYGIIFEIMYCCFPHCLQNIL